MSNTILTFMHNDRQTQVTIIESSGGDNALVVFIDTDYEPDNSDQRGGLRVLVNDDDVYVGAPYVSPYANGRLET